MFDLHKYAVLFLKDFLCILQIKVHKRYLIH